MQNIKKLMAEDDVNQIDLARETGFSHQTVSSYINDTYSPNVRFVIGAANLFGVSTDVILDLKDISSEKQLLLDISYNPLFCPHCGHKFKRLVIESSFGVPGQRILLE